MVKSEMNDIKPSVNILGTKYSIKIKKYDEDDYFKKNNVCGFCSMAEKEIVICDISTCPGWEDSSVVEQDEQIKSTLRHEIIHAFLCESGLYTCSLGCDSWAGNEEMIDWFALQGPKIYKAWESVGAI